MGGVRATTVGGALPRTYERAEVERLVIAAHVAIVGLRADIELAKDRLAAVEAEAASTKVVIGQVQSMVRDAQAEADRQRDAAARRASVTDRAAEIAAAHIVASARNEAPAADGAAA